MGILKEGINIKHISQDANIFINTAIKCESSKIRLFFKDKE